MRTEQALQLFDSLQDVDTGFMLGAWSGRAFPTGHPLDSALQAYGWRGKRFESEEQVHPLLFGGGRAFAVRPAWAWAALPLVERWPALRSGSAPRVLRWFLPLLRTRRAAARLRMMRFRGRTTAAMIYDDDIPVQDVFRRMDRDAVLGLMDGRGMERPFFFVLQREPGLTKPAAPADPA